MVKCRIEERLIDLRKELEVGQKALATLEEKSRSLHLLMLRISGAIQVLEELLNEEHAREREAGHSVNGATSVTAPVG